MYRTGQGPTILPSDNTAVFMCFAWISEQIAIISLYNINCLLYITVKESVYYAVRTGYLLLRCVLVSKRLILLATKRKVKLLTRSTEPAVAVILIMQSAMLLLAANACGGN